MSTVNFKIENFLGLNESPDGDSGLKSGEAVEMTNFRITAEYNLKKMSGYSLYTSDSGAADIDGMVWWNDLLVFVTDSKVFTFNGTTKTELDFVSGVTLTAGKCSLFVFNEKLYLLNGHEYLYWDGTNDIDEVAGYVPVVLIASNPASGAGTKYEAVNMLTTKRIQRFNGNNSATAYKMGEPEIDSIDMVIVNGQERTLTTHYTVTVGSDGYTTVTFGTAPTDGLDNVEIKYTKSTITNTDRFTALASSRRYHLSNSEIDSITEVKVDGTATTDYTANLIDGIVTLDSAPTTGKSVVIKWSKALTPKMKDMKYVQFFGGENNTRVFVYGDGSNTIYYGEPENGATKPSAEYFPELNRIDIDLDSVPVTSLVPYYSRLFIFKEDSVYYTTYSTLTGDDGTVIISFPTNNVTKSVGCSVYNGALSVPNGIIFPSNDGIYIAKGGYVYEQMSENLLSKRVDGTYKTFEQNNIITLNNQTLGEAWFIDGNDAIIYNYRNDTWYKYDILENALYASYHDGVIYFGNDGGEIFEFDGSLSYNGQAINAYWESGSMDFGYFNRKKWIDRIWLTLKSEANSGVTLDLESDVTSDYPEKDLSHGVATFASINFANFSFNTNDKPASKMARIKAKKFTFLKMILKNNTTTDTCTVMNMSAPVEVGGIKK